MNHQEIRAIACFAINKKALTSGRLILNLRQELLTIKQIIVEK